MPPEFEAEARAHPPSRRRLANHGESTANRSPIPREVPLLRLVIRLTGGIDEEPDDIADDDFDIDRLSVCSYWRCEMLFERKTANQRYCRKACRSRQNKWQRAQERRRARMAAGSPR